MNNILFLFLCLLSIFFCGLLLILYGILRFVEIMELEARKRIAETEALEVREKIIASMDDTTFEKYQVEFKSIRFHSEEKLQECQVCERKQIHCDNQSLSQAETL